jgi:hemerythrin-like domain-containing protein
MILEQLAMIETTIGPQSGRRGVLTKTNRNTLRELLRFFTRRISIHFKREAMLITALTRILGRKPEERNQFQSLLDEHRMLKADASAVMKKLNAQEKEAGGYSLLPERNNGFRTLVAELRTFVRRYRGHISCEERILFVLADMRLTAEQKQRISHRMLQV